MICLSGLLSSPRFIDLLASAKQANGDGDAVCESQRLDADGYECRESG